MSNLSLSVLFHFISAREHHNCSLERAGGSTAGSTWTSTSSAPNLRPLPGMVQKPPGGTHTAEGGSREMPVSVLPGGPVLVGKGLFCTPMKGFRLRDHEKPFHMGHFPRGAHFLGNSCPGSSGSAAFKFNSLLICGRKNSGEILIDLQIRLFSFLCEELNLKF